MLFLQTVIKVFILSCIFTGGLYIFDMLFLDKIESQEEIYIEPGYSSLPGQIIETLKLEKDYFPQDSNGSGVLETQETSIKTEEALPQISQKPRLEIYFSYIPTSFQLDAGYYSVMAISFLDASFINDKIESLKIEFHKKLVDVRGKMKNKTIKMWGLQGLTQAEFLSVFVHEFSHYIDIYYFSNSILGDISTNFYEISWDDTTVVKRGQKPSDFVSGYASTNQYEDFSESFTYFLLHNSDFKAKTGVSSILEKKYQFFRDFVFLSGEFSGTDFSTETPVGLYYWDITKIPFEVENFLQYIKIEI